ncbi:Metallo-dependent phosphatase-like protein, partial [Thamnocephalis sphaerospora]
MVHAQDFANAQGETLLRIIHFNDVYHLNESANEPVGGAARFYTALQQARAFVSQQEESLPHADALVLFSGDCFNPSIESSVTKGKHMVPFMNKLNIDVACYGNHDFDFGLAMLEKLTGSCNFPWLLSNVLNSETGEPLASGKKSLILERAGLRIGFIGLVEKEWLDTIPNLPSTLEYHDFVTVGRDLAQRLRTPEGGNCDLVIALTHMRLLNDELCVRELADDIDLVLGGHDHFAHYGGATRPDDGGLRLIKSGCDFRHLSRIELTIGKENEAHPSIITREVHADEDIVQLVESLTGEINAKLITPVGRTLTAWDARSTTVRLREAAIGNLAADLMRYHWPDSDIGLLCGGTIRSDSVYGPGVITKRDILDIFPFEDPAVVVRISGQVLLDTLESALSQVPKQEGRFPQVSGCRIIYEPTGTPGSRVRRVLARPGEEPLDLERIYTVSTRYYLACGNDGYEPL